MRDEYGGVERNFESCDGTGGQGRMSPGRQYRGFSGPDGSILNNTQVPFLPTCALLSLTLSPSFIVYILC